MDNEKEKPTIKELIDRLNNHAKRVGENEPYKLSSAEAQLIVKSVKVLSLECENPSDYDLVYVPFYPDEPEVPIQRDFTLKPLVSDYTGKPWTPRSHEIAQLYLDGKEYEEIAAIYNVTRERVRQCVAKARRQSLPKCSSTSSME